MVFVSKKSPTRCNKNDLNDFDMALLPQMIRGKIIILSTTTKWGTSLHILEGTKKMNSFPNQVTTLQNLSLYFNRFTYPYLDANDGKNHKQKSTQVGACAIVMFY